MEKTLPLEECSIYRVYFESKETKTYMIPVYQRNYAWEEDEITALVKDVHDSFVKDCNKPYYIGTLVTYKRGDSLYEVIDGQQRLTTIYIILKALGFKDIRNKLTYGARKVSASTIDHLDSYPNLGDEVDGGIRNGYQYAEKAISAIVMECEKKRFEQYFLHFVHIIHYNVPKDVDLNHYFEVMNSRGEQLEKHEIVKSTLCQELTKSEIATFSRVWEACSEMNIYIQQAFPDKTIFGNNCEDFVIMKFGDIPQQDESDGKKSILSLLDKPAKDIKKSVNIEQSDRFQPIIDFPNFLLIVLKVTLMGRDGFEPAKFVLDDKELLNEFLMALGATSDKAEFARQFAYNLLRARYCLDNYVIHHSMNDKEMTGDNPWKLQYYHFEKKKGYPENLAEGNVQDELVHLMSMFEVAFTARQRKNYLFYCMMYLFENHEPSGGDYLQFLQFLADKYFYDVYLNPDSLNERNQPVPNAFDSAMLANGKLNMDVCSYGTTDYRKRFKEIYRQGCSDIPLFVFNYTDYKLWQKYVKELRGYKYKKGSKERTDFFSELGCSDFELDLFKSFYFSRTRKSLEHFYPRAKAGDDKSLNLTEINCFGNFAMIGAEANSSGSDWDPKTKLDHYCDGKSNQVSVASLKFRIMMQVCQDNYLKMLNGKLHRIPGMEWDADDMQTHQQRMLDVIIR